VARRPKKHPDRKRPLPRAGRGELQPAKRERQGVLSALSSLETLEAAYGAWLERKLEHASERAALAQTRRRLDEQASFLMGAVKAAGAELEGAGAAQSLARRGDAARSLSEAERRLASARADVEARIAEADAAYARDAAAIRATIEDRARRSLEVARPKLRLLVRLLAGGRRIVHLERLGPDEAVLAVYALAGRLPSRYGFLFDDSTDDAQRPPPSLYPDEGVAPEEVRPDAPALREVVERSAVLPIKGFIPLFVPGPAGRDFVRLLQRGPVMEAELAEGDGFRSVLAAEEAERIAGHLLRLKVEGKIDLDVEMG